MINMYVPLKYKRIFLFLKIYIYSSICSKGDIEINSWKFFGLHNLLATGLISDQKVMMTALEASENKLVPQIFPEIVPVSIFIPDVWRNEQSLLR